MKIYGIQNNPSLKFSGLIVKNNKKIPTSSIINPTPQDLKVMAEKSKKQLDELGLVLIKEVKLSIKNVSRSKR